METYSIKLGGQELARLSGEGISPAKKQVLVAGTFNEFKPVDDPKLLRLVLDGKTILVCYVSGAENVSVEKVEA